MTELEDDSSLVQIWFRRWVIFDWFRSLASWVWANLGWFWTDFQNYPYWNTAEYMDSNFQSCDSELAGCRLRRESSNSFTSCSRMADEESVTAGKRPAVQYSSYAAKKTVAQGMMDIALITANANQLRYLIEFQSNAPTFYITLVLIVISIVLQITVGIFLIFKGRYDLKGQEKLEAANTINNIVVVGVFLVTVINVFIASFSITGDVALRPAGSTP